MENTETFRTALNGFNREDVAAYLEKAAERYNALKEEKTELKKMVTELEGQLYELSSAQEKSAAPSENLSESNEAVAALQTEVAQLRSENAGLLARLKEAESKAAAYADKVAEYDTLRQRIATLELDASRRAVEIEHNAEMRVKEMQQAARDEEAAFNRQMEATARVYQQSLSNESRNVTLTAKLVENEMSKIMQSLKELAASLAEKAGALDSKLAAPAKEGEAPEASE